MRYTVPVARDSLFKRLAVILLGVVLALALAEGVLQIAALFVRHQATGRGTAPSAQAAGAGPVILCVGDSYTYGSGSSSAGKSYPAQMEAWLRANDPGGGEWSVQNGGWPGRNSAEVARKLPGFLEEAHPQFVCMLVGLNNRWNMRGTDDAAADDAAEGKKTSPTATAATKEGPASGGFTWRLPRLFAIVVAAVRERTDPNFRAPAPAPADSTAAPPGSAALDLSDPVAALAQIRARRERTADVRPLLEALEQLRPRIRELGDPKATAALVLLLADVSRYPEAAEEGQLAKEQYGMTPELANALVKPLSHLDRIDEAIELGHLAVADAPNDPDRLRRLGEALRMGRRSEEALTLFTRLYLMSRDRDEYEKQVRKIDRAVLASDEMCTAVLAPLKLSEADLADVLVSLRRVREEKSAPPFEDALARDLVRMAKLATEAGASPVLVAYPQALGSLNLTLRRVAEENAIPLVDVEPTFRDSLRTASRDAFFVADGHCNDRGYAIVAAAVGRKVLELRRLAASRR